MRCIEMTHLLLLDLPVTWSTPWPRWDVITRRAAGFGGQFITTTEDRMLSLRKNTQQQQMCVYGTETVDNPINRSELLGAVNERQNENNQQEGTFWTNNSPGRAGISKQLISVQCLVE